MKTVYAPQKLPPELRIGDCLSPNRRGLLVGETVGRETRYTLVAAAGCGGFATVYEAVNECAEHVAVKILEAAHELDEKDFDRFKVRVRQAQGAGDHPNIVKCFDQGFEPVEDHTYPWYAMEFAAGDLGRVIEDRATTARGVSLWTCADVQPQIVAEFRAITAAVGTSTRRRSTSFIATSNRGMCS